MEINLKFQICHQDVCEASVKECSQSSWSFSEGLARFRALFNSEDFTFCAGVEVSEKRPIEGFLIR